LRSIAKLGGEDTSAMPGLVEVRNWGITR
jgi:hypothetical protein